MSAEEWIVKRVVVIGRRSLDLHAKVNLLSDVYVGMVAWRILEVSVKSLAVFQSGVLVVNRALKKKRNKMFS